MHAPTHSEHLEMGAQNQRAVPVRRTVGHGDVDVDVPGVHHLDSERAKECSKDPLQHLVERGDLRRRAAPDDDSDEGPGPSRVHDLHGACTDQMLLNERFAHASVVLAPITRARHDTCSGVVAEHRRDRLRAGERAAQRCGGAARPTPQRVTDSMHKGFEVFIGDDVSNAPGKAERHPEATIDLAGGACKRFGAPVGEHDELR